MTVKGFGGSPDAGIVCFEVSTEAGEFSLALAVDTGVGAGVD